MTNNSNIANSNAIRYELYAENIDGTVVIKNLEQNNYFIQPAQQLLENQQLIQGFSAEHVKRINLVAEFTQQIN